MKPVIIDFIPIHSICITTEDFWKENMYKRNTKSVIKITEKFLEFLCIITEDFWKENMYKKNNTKSVIKTTEKFLESLKKININLQKAKYFAEKTKNTSIQYEIKDKILKKVKIIECIHFNLEEQWYIIIENLNNSEKTLTHTNNFYKIIKNMNKNNRYLPVFSDRINLLTKYSKEYEQETNKCLNEIITIMQKYSA